MPALSPDALAATATPGGYLPETRLALRSFFYAPTVAAALIAADEQEATVVPAGVLESLPPCALCEAAAQLHCPLFLGFAADAEVTARPHDEVMAYPAARSITLFVQSAAHHCANFAPTRFELWDEIASWVRLKAVQAKGSLSLPLWQADLFTTQPLSS